MTLTCTCTIVRNASRALTRYYEDAFDGTGLTVTQFSILRALQREGEMPLSPLAELLVMERTSLYRSIAPLEKNGAIAIKPGPNRKIRVAHLTATGEAMIEQTLPAWQATQARVIKAFGKDNWASLSTALTAIPNLVEHLDSNS